ncbi:calumenin-A [Eucalyptus grandis]|uniref:calumenin-A n=1 Tax=Eucalyptus grandis TaxID=71139 RepID=UPI00192EFB79|nr:calumenin-A [Eucalyptus grandis]
MAKAVVYALAATALMAFIIFSPMGQKGRNHLRSNRRLGIILSHPTFDPLVTELERRREGEHADREDPPASTGIGSPISRNEYLTDEGELNTTSRLLFLFPLLDDAPKDGAVSFKELEAWNVGQAHERLAYQTQKELAFFDKDGDGAISFREYLPQFSDEDIERNGSAHGEAGWWKEKFLNADVDQTGTLSFNEFMDFLHPEDSNNTEIWKWLLWQKLKQMDYDGDGKLNLDEFKDHIYDIYKNYVEFDAHGGHVPTPEQKFTNLDVNNNKLLEVEEMIPILHYLNPGELSHAKYYTAFLIREADDNKDGKLSLEEMLNHEYMFYASLFEEDEEDDEMHDEL